MDRNTTTIVYTPPPAPAAVPDVNTRRMVARLQAWLPMIGSPDLKQHLKLDQFGGDDEWSIGVHDTGLAVDCGHGFKLRGLTVQSVKGYRLLRWRSSPGTRLDPPEVWDETILETLDPLAVLVALADQLARQRIGDLPALTGDLAEPETAPEEH